MKKLPKNCHLNFRAKFFMCFANFQKIWIFKPKLYIWLICKLFEFSRQKCIFGDDSVFENYSKSLILQNRELILFFDENTYLNFRAKNVNLTNLQIIWIFPPKMYIWPYLTYLTNLQKFEFSRQNCQQCT